MVNKTKYGATLFCLLLVTCRFISSCSSVNISKYYSQNQKTLDSIQQSYKTQSLRRPFSIEFTDKTFNNVSIEIWTDSLKYIYEFESGETRMRDTLTKYKLPVQAINELIKKMKSIHCTWINNLDYYVNGKKNELVFMSIRPRSLYTPFTNKKYYIITYFAQPQYYDSDGVLLDNRKRRKIRKINNDVFKRINDRVAYTISDRFR